MTLPIEEAYIDVAYAEPKAPNWVIQDILPVGLVVLSGPPKKSFKSLQALLFGALCADWPVKALPQWMKCMRGGPSLINSYEADAGVIRYILETEVGLKVQPGSIFVAHDPRKFQLDQPETANKMLDYMEEKQPILTVMDPFRNMHSGDENDSGNIQTLLTPLVAFAHETESTVLMIHHVNKPTEGKDGSSFYAMRGSSALPGLADGLITVENTKTEGNIIINATFKRGMSYRRTIHLGVPGFGWGVNGYEVFDEVTQKILLEYQRHTDCPPMRNPVVMAATLKLPIMQVKEALEAFQRNNLL